MPGITGDPSGVAVEQTGGKRVEGDLLRIDRRSRENSRRRAYRFSPAERQALMDALGDALAAYPDVVFAYVHGSFARRGPFRDVDVAIYLTPGAPVPAERALIMNQELGDGIARTLHRRVVPPFDVRVLNQAPLGFCYQMLLRGRLVFSRDESARVGWVARIVERYLDLQPLQRQALKEAMTA